MTKSSSNFLIGDFDIDMWLEVLFGALDNFLEVLDVEAVAVELIDVLEDEFFAIEVNFGVVF